MCDMESETSNVSRPLTEPSYGWWYQHICILCDNDDHIQDMVLPEGFELGLPSGYDLVFARFINIGHRRKSAFMPPFQGGLFCLVRTRHPLPGKKVAHFSMLEISEGRRVLFFLSVIIHALICCTGYPKPVVHSHSAILEGHGCGWYRPSY